ncbi:MAG: ATP-binding cassette domain-containing protein [Candidatus Auribacter fodinae]|jgi:ABC-type multidrug transport system ATPase subunit|uniref:ATP-binding cassette domain-containing protein n=1 Tax=Candidatus Auribacter fodinae TaxID=2093366 RepID=A0A3A4R0C2_9BACT|nr:MAG: ATP-binding cassette domain-containing protein [Candidatus Auribacter fodinae]
MVTLLKNKSFIKTIALICLFALLHSDYKCVAAAPEHNSSPPVSVPPLLTESITDTPSGRPQVYLIEDAHCVPSVQKRITDTLRELYQSHGINRVFIEGCSGDQDFSYLRLYPLEQERKQILTDNIEKGIITGVEYFASTFPAEHDLYITGLEDSRLYDDNKTALKAVSEQMDIRNQLFEFVNELNNWISENTSPEIAGYVSEINNNNLLHVVESLMKDRDILIQSELFADYAAMENYFKTIRILSSINLETVFLEANALISDEVILKNIRIDKKQLYNRIARFYLLPSQKDDIDFEILRCIRGSNRYANLERYLSNNLALKGTDLSLIDRQMHEFLIEYLYTLCTSDMERAVLRSYFTFQKVDRLIELKCSAEEARQYLNKPFMDSLVEYVSELPSHLAERQLSMVNSILPVMFEAMNFYQKAIQRDKAIQDNFLRAYTELKDPCVVIMGGFHSSKFRDFLTAENIPVTVIRPHSNDEPELLHKIYYQHFMTGFNMTETVYNKNSLGTQPILSASGQGQMGPSAIWFNQILGSLVDAVRPVPALASNWVSAMKKNLVYAVSRVKMLIILSSIIALLGVQSPLFAQAVTPPAVTPAPIVTQTPRPLSIEQRMAAYAQRIQIDRSQLLADLTSTDRLLQAIALKELIERNDYSTIQSVFETTDSLALRQILLGKVMQEKQYATLANMFMFLENQSRLAQQQTAQGTAPIPVQPAIDPYLDQTFQLFDLMMISTVQSDLSFLSNTNEIKDVATRQSLKYMFVYYIEHSAGNTQQRFIDAIFQITELSDLYGIYNSYTEPQASVQRQIIFDPQKPNMYYSHSLDLMRTLARNKLMEISLQARLDNILSRSTKGITASIYAEDYADAMVLKGMFDVKHPDFIPAFKAYFPEVFESVASNLEQKFADARSQLVISPSQAYQREFKQVSPDQQKLFIYDNQKFQSDIEMIDWYASMGVMHSVDYLIRTSTDNDLIENVLRQYYIHNIPKLNEFHAYFSTINPYISDRILTLLHESFLMNPDKYFDLKTNNDVVMQALLKLARFQRLNSFYPSVWYYLLDNIQSEYSLALIVEDNKIAGTVLTQDELKDVEQELSNRFVMFTLNTTIEDLKLKEQKYAFSDRTQTINQILTDLNLLQSRLSTPDRLIAKYNLESAYKTWREKMHSIAQDQFIRPHVLTRVFNLSLLPVAVTGGMILVSYLLLWFGISGFKFRKKKNAVEQPVVELTQPQQETPETNMSFMEINLFLDDFSRLKPHEITIEDLDALHATLKKTKSQLKYFINLEVVNNIFQTLYTCSRMPDQDTYFHTQAQTVFKQMQKILGNGDDEYVLFKPQAVGQKSVKADPPRFLEVLLSVFTFGHSQKRIVAEMNKLIDMSGFTDNYNILRRRLALFRLLYLFAKLGFFSVLAMAPVIDLTLGFVSISLVIIFQTFDIFLYFLAVRGNEEMKDWFRMQFSRVAKFDNRIEFEKAAEAVAEGETARWTIMSIWINIIGAFAVVTFISPWFLIPYITIITLVFFIWKKMIGEEENVYVKKSDFYAPLFGTIAKIVIPAIGLSFGFLLQAFIVTNLYEAMVQFGGGQFLRVFSKAAHSLKKLRLTLEDVIGNGNIVSEQSWQSDEPAYQEVPQKIDTFIFDNISSAILNKAEQPIVDQISLKFKRRELIYINAVSGMGKTTLARLLAHYYKTTTGSTSIEVNGKKIAVSADNFSHKSLRKMFNYLKFDHIPHLPVKDILDDANVSPKMFLQFIGKFLPHISQQHLEKPLNDFPVNEKKFLMLAAYFYINKPKFLVLDDLLTGVSEDITKLMVDFLTKARNIYGTTTIIIDEQVHNSLLPEFDAKYAFTAGKIVPFKEKVKFGMWLKTPVSDEKTAPEYIAEEKSSEARITMPPSSDQAGADQWSGSEPVHNFMEAVHSQLPAVPSSKEILDPVVRANITAIASVAGLIIDFTNLDDANDRLRLFMKYQKGPSVEQEAAQIISNILVEENGTGPLPSVFRDKEELLVQIVNELKTTKKLGDIRLTSIYNVLSTDRVAKLVSYEMDTGFHWPLTAFVSDVATYVNIFNSEDTQHRLKLWHDYTHAPKDSAPYVAGEVIGRLLAKQKTTAHAPSDNPFTTVNITLHTLELIIGSSSLSSLFESLLKNINAEKLSVFVDTELARRREDMLNSHFSVLQNEANETITGKTIYEIWGIKMLFDQLNVSYALLPHMLKTYSYVELRHKFFIIRDAGAPVTSVSMRMNSAEELREYASKYQLGQEIKELNAEKIAPIRTNQRFAPVCAILDSAA